MVTLMFTAQSQFIARILNEKPNMLTNRDEVVMINQTPSQHPLQQPLRNLVITDYLGSTSSHRGGAHGEQTMGNQGLWPARRRFGGDLVRSDATQRGET